jgi:Copper type II ascorbate-dependent monooxygenase, C-terminal domain/Copper type II ascorbate-dependent monooxygenase, N-terminal domain
MVFGWAPGELPFALPSNMGFPLGPANRGFLSFAMQIHYDNPELLNDIVDSSGVRIYYVNKTRPIQAGMFVLGDPEVNLANQPVGDGVREHTFECGSGCSAAALPESGVTVLRTNLHMHKTAVQARSEHIRNGTVLNNVTVEFFDFAQQGGQLVQAEPFTVLPGDSFRARCYFVNSLSNTTIFGLASSNEMCVAYMLYYPRQTIEVNENQFTWSCAYQYVDPCSTEYSSRALNDVGELGRTFGSPFPQVNPEFLQAGTSGSFNNSIQCPVATSPPTDNAVADSSSAGLVVAFYWAFIALSCVAAGLS